jgi:hypothetical protein
MRNINTGVIYTSTDNSIDLKFGSAVYISFISLILGIVCFFIQLRSFRLQKRAKSVNSNNTTTYWASRSDVFRSSVFGSTGTDIGSVCEK